MKNFHDIYDSEGYSLAPPHLHKRLRIRRHFRPLTDTPITPEEQAAQYREKMRMETQFQREAACPEHQWSVVSHEEMRCTQCGAYEFVYDE